MATTIRDVALQARVSVSTVSRVLNGTAGVAEAKQARVWAAVEALDYVPNPAARSLLGQGTGGLGVLLPFVSGEFFSEFLGGVDLAAREGRYFLTISATHRRPEEFATVLRALDRRVDGVLVMSTEAPAASFAAALPPDVPVTFVNTVVDGTRFDAVNFDNFGGARAVARHLVARGHRRIAHVRGPGRAHDARERLDGYRAALAEADVPFDRALVVGDDFSRESGLAAVAPLLALASPPTAIFAANDEAAIGVLRGLALAGLRVPNDVAVAGFDDAPIAQYTTPPLTTAHVPVRELGERAMRRLIARADGHGGDPEQVVLPVELVVRESTGPA